MWGINWLHYPHCVSEGHVLFEYFMTCSSGQHYVQHLSQDAVQNQIPHGMKMLNSSDHLAADVKVENIFES